jgi:hypothetical protein
VLLICQGLEAWLELHGNVQTLLCKAKRVSLNRIAVEFSQIPGKADSAAGKMSREELTHRLNRASK